MDDTVSNGPADIRFYQLDRQPLAAVLPKLLERVLAAGMRAVVRLPDEARRDEIDKALWLYDPDSFLAHGTAATGHGERQPVWLTTGEDRPNGARALVLVDAVAPPADLSGYERCLFMFDGQDEAAQARARAAWKGFRDAGRQVSYWQQKPAGGWEQKG